MAVADIIVVGAGALGVAAAEALRARGRSVVILAPDETSASARAAGMLAPAFEWLLDGPMAAHADIMKAARDLWPAVAGRAGLSLHREGAEWRGADAAEVAERLAGAGFAVELKDGAAVTPEDWRLEPEQALAALSRGAGRVVGRMTGLERRGDGFTVITEAGARLEAGAMVLASGWAAPEVGIGLPPITPVKGQAVRLIGAAPARVVRGEGVYVAPAPGGAMVGATMEAGAADIAVDPAVIEDLLARARALVPEIAGAEVDEAYAGVRGASPDGLPYAGLIAPGLAVALAPRRNGWLFAPMAAGIVADALEGIGPDRSGRFDPGRFAP